MVLTRNKKDEAQKHLQNCLAAVIAARSSAKGIADDEVEEIQRLIHKIAEKVERASEPKS